MVSLDFDVRDDSKEGRTLRFPDVAPQKLPTRVVVRTRKSDDLGALRSVRVGQVEVDDLRHRWCVRGLSARSARGYNAKGGERGVLFARPLADATANPSTSATIWSCDACECAIFLRKSCVGSCDLAKSAFYKHVNPVSTKPGRIGRRDLQGQGEERPRRGCSQ